MYGRILLTSTSIDERRAPMRATRLQRPRKTQGMEFMECCGRVCEERCRFGEGREQTRRVAGQGILRVF
jgi:hypothetical protein